MPFVLGRGERSAPLEKPAGRIGSFRAIDGSEGAPLYLDLDGPHATLIVGKRGYGKSYTMGVMAEELARSRAVAPVVLDPMGVFDTLAETADGEPVPADVCTRPCVTPDSLDPRSWCRLLGLSPESGAGGLVWRAAQVASSLPAMRATIEETDAPAEDCRAATNHLRLAESWDVFDPAGLDVGRLGRSAVTVLDLSGLADAPANAVGRAVAETLYRARVREEIPRLPWLLVDEAHTFFDGVARPALHRILTRGRAPGVSVALATQRPSAISDVGRSQSDLVVSHRLTAAADVEALAAAQPTYMRTPLADRMPTASGEVVIVDDATEEVLAARIRPRATPHGGDSPSASDLIVTSPPSDG